MGAYNRTAATRRQMLQIAIVGFAAAVAPGRAWAQLGAAQPKRFGDAHAHLFNLADLPIRGFLRHVGLPAGIERKGPLPALLDLVDRLRPMARTAAGELADHQANIPPRRVHSSELFDQAMLHIEEGKKRSSIERLSLRRLAKLAGRELELADSYGLLAALIEAVEALAQRGGRTLRQVLGVKEPGELDVIFGGCPAPIRSRFADRVLRMFGGGTPECPEAARGSGELSMAALRAQLQWVHLMVQPRRVLLDRYLEVVHDKGRSASTVVNLLVDYDRWLGDFPSAGSRHREQIAFWTRLARDRRERIDIRTFAGFDPLKHAEERNDSGRSAYLDELVAFYRNRTDRSASHVVHGFKLYPPMGFAPSGNVAWMFEGNSPTLATIRARWAARFPDRLLHDELNGALDDFFGTCSREGIPVLTHAFHSNEAGRCFGSRASPLGWVPVLERHKGLRICLGHFADAEDFIDGMGLVRAGKPLPPRDWPLTGTHRLLEMNSNDVGETYADISYMSELLLERAGIGRERAISFFLELREYCEKYDKGCRHIMFGTDWLLLAREAGNERYVGTIREAMAKALWPDDWQDNLLYGNLLRFLNG